MKFTDGEFSRLDGDDPPLNRKLLVSGIDEVVQHWENNRENNRPIETFIKSIDGKLPDVKALNAAIPKEEWRTGPGGEPSEPWRHLSVIYLVDTVTAESFTLANSTAGMWSCFRDLKDRVKTMALLRGHMVRPFVKLASRKMKTSYGMKNRPHLEVIEWRRFGNPPEGPALAPPPPTPPAAAVPASPAPPTPTLAVPPTQPAAPTVATPPAPATPAPATPPAKVAASQPIDEFGEPVEPVTLVEEMNDEIPF